MTLILLIRHGLTPATGIRLSGWTPGVHLSAEGKSQADALASALGQAPISAIYSSPLERCRETAAPLARAKGLQVKRDRAIGEVGYGDWTNRPLRQLARTKLWPVIQQTPSNVRFPGGESIPEVQARVVARIRGLADRHGGEVVALFSHGDPIRLALAHFAGTPIDLFQRLVVSPASVSALALGGGAPKVLAVNSTGSLEAVFPAEGGRMT